MNFDFAKKRITLLIAPVDMRAGYGRLAVIAQALLNIDVDEKRDLVVFVSKRRQIVKLIWSDDHGSALLTRRLRAGAFETFRVRIDDPAGKSFSIRDLNSFLDGEPIFERR